jgi:hypothetical protein
LGVRPTRSGSSAFTVFALITAYRQSTQTSGNTSRIRVENSIGETIATLSVYEFAGPNTRWAIRAVNTAGTGNPATDPSNIVLGRTYAVVGKVRQDGSLMVSELTVDGRIVDTDSISATMQGDGGGGYLRIELTQSGSATRQGSMVHAAYVWDRWISDGESQFVTQNPWSGFVERPSLFQPGLGAYDYGASALYPANVAAQSNLTGAHTTVDESPASPDGNWMTFVPP